MDGCPGAEGPPDLGDVCRAAVGVGASSDDVLGGERTQALDLPRDADGLLRVDRSQGGGVQPAFKSSVRDRVQVLALAAW